MLGKSFSDKTDPIFEIIKLETHPKAMSGPWYQQVKCALYARSIRPSWQPCAIEVISHKFVNTVFL